ncbi:hypothetical protein LTR86_009217 [Recurvomyces mirabilis]|nr:hypothetical protein LTR86_009217 [Recurvomyces mirabilis]
MGEDVQSPPPSWQTTFEYYNPLHFRRGKTAPASTTATTTAPVYSRDFAYAEDGGKKGGVRLLAHPPMHVVDETGRKTRIIGTVLANKRDAPWTSAKTFAEYVSPFFSLLLHQVSSPKTYL